MPAPLIEPGRGHNVLRFFERLASRGALPALAEARVVTTASDLLAEASDWEERLARYDVGLGTVCAFVGDYASGSVSLTLALMRLGAIAMPLTKAALPQLTEMISIAGARILIRLGSHEDGPVAIESIDVQATNALVSTFRATAHPGLIVFTSGSSGRPKGILHDFDRVLGKFDATRQPWRTVLFLMMDHFGGINTLLGCLANGGLAIAVPERAPETVCKSIEAHAAELLPTTPTFLNMLLVAGSWRNFDLSSLRLITYGAEPMPEATLRRIADIFPNAQFKQTYGLSELGVLHSRSRDRTSLWLNVGGRGFETRVVDRVLHIRSTSNMVGYLNAPSPIDADGWMNTGDLVEERDGMIRFLGRQSEVINVGGQKVFPAEVEAVLLEAVGVAEATVYGARHSLLGQAVRARVSLVGNEDIEEATERLRSFCRERLPKYKIPMAFDIVTMDAQVGDRGKKNRATSHL